MSLTIRAFIGEKKLLEKAAASLKGARVADLADGLGILPLTEAAEAAFPPAKGSDPFPAIGVTAALAAWASGASAAGPVAYMSADYATGKNFQGAVVWAGGKVVGGPWQDATAWDPREDASARPVNAALRLLGASAKGCNDEWDAVGLVRHRTTDEWAAAKS